MRRGLPGWLGVLALASGMAHAQAAPPGRLARLAFASGEVHVAGDAAPPNMPLVEGQAIETGGDGEVEIEFEDGSLARLTPNSTLILERMAVDGEAGSTTRLALRNGLAYFELRAAPRFSYTVVAAGDILTPIENASFRLNLDRAPAAVAVLDGAIHIERDGAYATEVRSGESFRADPAAGGRYFLTREIAPDTWDQWNESRDQMAADAAAGQTPARDGYAGSQGYGWSDLDANGQWYDVPGQGQVWQPAGGDAAAFDPYGDGSWVWTPGAGYVWASSYAWGWTPYRCGGWSYWSGFGWGWVPNAGCGGFGYAGYGGFYGFGGHGGYGGYVNIVQSPRRYPVRIPMPVRGPKHPIVAVHQPFVAAGTTATRSPTSPIGGPASHPIGTPAGSLLGSPAGSPVSINGVLAQPILPVRQSYTARGGSAVGSGLVRDYPIDRGRPVLGVPAGQGGLTPYRPDRSGPAPLARPGLAPLARPVAPVSRGYAAPPPAAAGSAAPYARPIQPTRVAPQATLPRVAAPAAPPVHIAAPPTAPASHPAPSGGGGKR